MANSVTGNPTSDARGCANSYMCLTAPELWPEQAKLWFALHDKFFWQKRATAVGYREYPNDVRHANWTMDVDAGPVIAGYGVSASAFGVGAARKNGRFDLAYPLAAEMLATVVELPNGALAVPRLLSNFSDAPLLGEAAILWQLSIQPEAGFPVRTGGRIPTYVYLLVGTLFVFGLWRILAAIWAFNQGRRGPEPETWVPRFQVIAWILLIVGAVVMFCLKHALISIALVLMAILLPIRKRKRVPKGVEDWPGAQPDTGGNTAAKPNR